jgi:phage baseplate assembly protein W
MTIYKGFSSQNRFKNFRLTDFELVQQDLINHFHIRKGEKLMNPEFGTIIWNLIHEPFTEDLKSVISQDVRTIANYDPRIKIDSIVVIEHDRGMQLELNLTYLSTNQTKKMQLLFDKESNSIATL